jgi:hypothetical protein
VTNKYQKNTRKTSTRPGLAVPDAVTIAMGEIADDLHEDLLAVGAGLHVMDSLMEADVAAACGPRGKHDPERKATPTGYPSAQPVPTPQSGAPARTGGCSFRSAGPQRRGAGTAHASTHCSARPRSGRRVHPADASSQVPGARRRPGRARRSRSPGTPTASRARWRAGTRAPQRQPRHPWAQRSTWARYRRGRRRSWCCRPTPRPPGGGQPRPRVLPRGSRTPRRRPPRRPTRDCAGPPG